MQNYKLTIAYDGTRYQGWQGQGNTGNTLQARLEGVLCRLSSEQVEVHASGRTDAGVHAAGQVVSFALANPIPPDALMEHLNCYLPQDMGVMALEYAPPRFHARLNAVGKTYVYRIWNDPRPDVFARRFRYTEPRPLDVAAMGQAARLLEGQHDFRSFCGLTRFKKSTVRTIFSIEITRQQEEVCLRFTGDGFLNRMVRILAGTLVEVGLGLRTPDSMTDVLAACDRSHAAGALPAHGLTLEQVYYDSIPNT